MVDRRRSACTRPATVHDDRVAREPPDPWDVELERRGGSRTPAVSRSKASAHTSATTIGDAINAETRPRAWVVRALANPAATSNTSLNKPALTHRFSSSGDPERRALAEPRPSARSRMPTVRINNVIDDPGGICSQRRNRFGNPPSATPAQSRTAAIAVTDERSRLLIILGRPNPDLSFVADQGRSNDQSDAQNAQSAVILRAPIGSYGTEPLSRFSQVRSVSSTSMSPVRISIVPLTRRGASPELMYPHRR